MKVLICGDRRWLDEAAVRKRMSFLKLDTELIVGDCRGADTMAYKIAGEMGFVRRQFVASWGQYGKAAGPIRNREMLDTKPDLVIAFHDNISTSRGTANTVHEARQRGIPTEVRNGYFCYQRFNMPDGPQEPE